MANFFRQLESNTIPQIKARLNLELNQGGASQAFRDVWAKINRTTIKANIIRLLIDMPGAYDSLSAAVAQYADASGPPHLKMQTNYKALHKLAKAVMAVTSAASPSAGVGLQALEIINPQFDNDNQLWLGTPTLQQIPSTKQWSTSAGKAITINVAAAFGAMGRRSAFVVYGLPTQMQPTNVKDVGWLVSNTRYGVFAHFGGNASPLPAPLQTIGADRKHDWDLYTTALPRYLKSNLTVKQIKVAFSLMVSNSCEKENELTADSKMTMPPELAWIGRIARKCTALRAKMQGLYSQLAIGLYMAIAEERTDEIQTTWAGLVAVCEVYLMVAKLLQTAQCTPGTQAAVFVSAVAIPHMRVILEACGFVASDIV